MPYCWEARSRCSQFTRARFCIPGRGAWDYYAPHRESALPLTAELSLREAELQEILHKVGVPHAPLATDQEFFDEQSRHNRLAGARIVGEQEAQRLAGKHFTVNRGDLMRERLDLRGADGKIGIEQISGLTAHWFGTVPAVILGGAGTLLVVGIWAWMFPELRAVDSLDAPGNG